MWAMTMGHLRRSGDDSPVTPPLRIGRRAVLAFMLSSTASTTWAMAGLFGPAKRHFLPGGQGEMNGSNWLNAARIDNAGRVSERARPGQEFLLGFPDHDLPVRWEGTQVAWNGGGTEEAPVHIIFGRPEGDGAAGLAEAYRDPPLLHMEGNETGPDERPDVGGDPYMVFGPDSSHLRVAGPVYRRSGGDGFFKIDAGATVRDLVFSDIHARRAGRVIETEEGTAVRDLLVERCSALGLIRGFARFHDLSDAEFRDLDLDADFIDGGGGAVCQIISVTRGTGLEFRNLRLAKAVNSLAARERGSTYIQGDGLVLEEETRDVRIDDCHAFDMGDGGFDLKSEGVHLTNCTATRCKLGIRIWSHHPDNLVEACTVTEPVRRPFNDGSCLWVAGNLTVRDCTLVSAEDMSPIRFGPGPDGTPEPTLRIQGGAITLAEEAGLVIGSPGAIELENVQINGLETSGRFYWTGLEMLMP